MKVDIVMPKMGESLQEGTITKWLKKEGDKVERDEMILEISTDKVDTEVPSPAAGILTKILAQENETVEVGKKIAELDTEASEGAAPTPTEIAPEQKEAAQPEPKKEEPAPAEPKQETIPEPKEPKNEEKHEAPKQAPQGETSANVQLVDVVMPKMGESLQEGTITKWLKQPGDQIERDEMILEISTDKVDTEVPSPVAGVLHDIFFRENDTVEVGKVIARIAVGGKAEAVQQTGQKLEEKEAPQPKPIEKKETQPKAEEKPAEPAKEEISQKEGKQFFSPLVRSIAEKENISLNELKSIKGSGEEGRVTKQDVLNYLEQRKKAPAPEAKKEEAKAQPAPQPQQQKQPEAQPQYKPATAIEQGENIEIIPMDRIRQRIAEHMVYSVHTSAHVTSVDEADVSNIVKFRNKYKDEFEKREGFKLTFMPFFAKAAIEALRAYPMVNVSVDEKNIVRHKQINLSFATALPDNNLIVPVIKNADALSLSGLARAIYDLANRARTKKLNPDDIMGGTFAITNFGTFGTLFGTPIINQPQTAIMGMGAIKKRPVVKEVEGEDVIIIRDMTFVSITYDHRVIDGQLAGLWLRALVNSLEGMNESNLSL